MIIKDENRKENHALELEAGDMVCVQGIKAIIKEIAFQEYWGRYGFITEFRDTRGVYRSWKQEVDGGQVIPKQNLIYRNKSAVPQNVIENVKKYFNENEYLKSYEVLHVVRGSDHPDDSYLYMVSAKKSDGTFAVWTGWNDTTQSLNFGHYNLQYEMDCDEVFEEYFNKISGITVVN